MALTPDGPLPGELGVEGAQAHLGLRAGLQLGNNGTEDATPGAGLGQRLLRDDSLVAPESLLAGQGGAAATDIPQGHPNERRSKAKPRLPVCPQAS